MTIWPLDTIDDALGLVSAASSLQLLACLTMWNAFYSLLWGFSGSMMYDLFNDPSLLDRERLIRSYVGDGPVDRILARRLPNLERGGWVDIDGPDAAAAAEGPRHGGRHARGLQAVFARDGRRREVSVLASCDRGRGRAVRCSGAARSRRSPRSRRRGNIYVTIIVVACVTAPLVFMAGPSIVGEPLSTEGRAFLVLMHLALGGFLFHFMTLPDRSVTLRILVELLLRQASALTLAALGRRYGVRTMIGSRLEQLRAGQFLDDSPGRRASR